MQFRQTWYCILQEMLSWHSGSYNLIQYIDMIWNGSISSLLMFHFCRFLMAKATPQSLCRCASLRLRPSVLFVESICKKENSIFFLFSHGMSWLHLARTLDSWNLWDFTCLISLNMLGCLHLMCQKNLIFCSARPDAVVWGGALRACRCSEAAPRGQSHRLSGKRVWSGPQVRHGDRVVLYMLYCAWQHFAGWKLRLVAARRHQHHQRYLKALRCW